MELAAFPPSCPSAPDPGVPSAREPRAMAGRPEGHPGPEEEEKGTEEASAAAPLPGCWEAMAAPQAPARDSADSSFLFFSPHT